MKILIVDDDPRLRDLVALALDRAGFAVVSTGDGQRALVHAARERPDLVVLDVGLPELDGFEVCRRLRRTSDVPILFLTARDDEVDRIVGLELGADDYVTKPFSPRELVARVRAILKRASGTVQPDLLRYGQVVLDRRAMRCTVNDKSVDLTGTEFQLLATLLSAPDRLHTRPQVVTAVWGAGSPVADRTLDSHLRNLRRKLAEAGLPEAVETRHGLGLRLGPCA